MRAMVAGLAVGCVLLTACGGDDDAPARPAEPSQSVSPSSTPATTPPTSSPESTPASAETGTVITTGSSQFGEILFDDTGQAIYLFDREETTEPDCYDECAEAWPPVLTEGEPVAAGDARADALGTTERSDGTTQVTYAGHPLYYYAHEGKNEVLCHNVREFGGLWLVLTPTGEVP